MIGRFHQTLGVIVAIGVGLAVGRFVFPSAPEPRAAAPVNSVTPPEPRVRFETSRVAESLPRESAPPESAPYVSVLTPENSPPPPSLTTKIGAPTGDPNIIFQTGKDASFVAVEAGAMQRLLDAVRISCQFGPGYGALWKDGQATTVTSSWQGGPIMYDQIAMSEGAAMMVGSEGATGSKTGEVKVRAAATKTGLHFSSFVPRGDLISTTVFAALDDKQRFIAVMSLHSTGFNYNSSQFHGVCDVLY
jgi:hypothetical protein